MAPPPRCSDTLPVPLKSALVVRTWECIPPPEKAVAIMCADASQLPVKWLSRNDVDAVMQLYSPTWWELRRDTMRAVYNVSEFFSFGQWYWNCNRVWMEQVWQARLLGCCQFSQNNCAVRDFT